MPLDLSLITVRHLLYFFAAFILVFGIIGLLLRHAKPFLRSVVHVPQTYYAGAVVIGVIACLVYFALPDPRLIIGLLSAGFFIALVGIHDENHPLTPGQQLAWQIVITTIVVSWGWVIQHVSHPAGIGVFSLNQLSFGPFFWPGSILTVLWLLLLMNAMNWLDGTDGLAAGVGTVAFLALGAVSLLPSIYDTKTLSLALIGAGAFLGFLLWNFPRARVYLGTSGSWFLGLYLGLVALLSGGKIVTTLLVLALPVLDFGLVAVQRLIKKQPPWRGDTVTHLHHRLLQRGFSPRVITLSAMVLTALLGLLALTLQTHQKILALIVSASMLTIIGFRLFSFHE